uniref:Kinesin motor domain-containing protein n=1 Tax=Chromera velia CCMP2878 TaxID=1169474 RepID=A0A0K6S9D5_9ALVE|eukprot:Cvel_27741.t1-p1 / transcript=Cvel_27741.t1 / gene=Cvel_27741 / organism=Chromera_velia_CCMP2878 / gene_product=Kinesin-related protein 11, putative / transcript_product=Kinesin-related protein 11, putative / location=Cvel_scaffold3514:226-9962(+) / protein_length=675 / sequence_SO=supercontig / SO=protein_coding / is_pseudo=false
MVYTVCLSCLEIYNEEVFDLLEADVKKEHKFLTNAEGQLEVSNLSEVLVDGVEEVMGLIEKCEGQRKVDETARNRTSSRSHTMYRLKVVGEEKNWEGRELGGGVQVGILNLVDLAGSESAKKAATYDVEKNKKLQREGGNINKSLLALSKVIEGLSKQNGAFVNYRESKLTRLLENSLGGNARTAVVCICSLAKMNYFETESTLKFASRCKKVKNKAKRNFVSKVENPLKRETHERLQEKERELCEKEVEIERLRLEKTQLREEVVSLTKQLQSGAFPEVVLTSGENVRKRRVTVGGGETLGPKIQRAPLAARFSPNATDAPRGAENANEAEILAEMGRREKERKEAENAKEILFAELDLLRNAVRAAEARLEKETSQRAHWEATSQSALFALRSDLSAETQKQEALQSELRNMQDALNAKEVQLREEQSTFQKKDAEVRELQKAVETLEASLVALRQEKRAMETSATEAAAVAASGREDLEAALAGARRERAALQALMGGLQEEITAKQSQMSDWGSDFRKEQERRKALEAHVENLKGQKEKVEWELEGETEGRKQADREKKELAMRLGAMENELKAVHEELKVAKRERRKEREMRSQGERAHRETLQALRFAQAELRSSQGELEEVRELLRAKDRRGGPFRCPQCLDSFTSQHGLNVHFGRMHPQSDRNSVRM